MTGGARRGKRRRVTAEARDQGGIDQPRPRVEAPASALTLFASVSRLHIVSIASLASLTFGWIFSGKYLWAAAIFAAFDWFFVNLMNRVADIAEDKQNGIRGTGFVEKHARALTILGVTVLVVTMVAGFFLLPRAMQPLRVVFHLIGLAYNYKILPGKRRFKETYFFKNTMSGVLFILSVFAYPIALMPAFSPGIGWPTVIALAVFFFLFEISYEVLYDLRDAEGDRKFGIPTYPAVHGEKTAVRIVDALIAGAILALVGAYAAGIVPWKGVVMVIAPVIQLAVYKHAHKTRRVEAKDCIRLTWIGAGLLFGYQIWILLRLPGV
jgi:4-hydroxybenzoate polyprenyltransferase